MTASKGRGATAPAVRTGFLLDLGRCVGCGACALACRLENRLPPGVSWRRIVPLNLARHSGGPTYFFSLACHHCQDPPCVRGCPSGALGRRPDGVVILATDLCLGCRYCEMACPFGAPAYDSGAGVMTKCHLCHHRLDRDRLPACVEACPTGALGFAGDHAAAAQGAEDVPGFVDPGGARPGLFLSPPGGGIRGAAYQGLLRILAGLDPGEEGDDHG